MSFYINGGTQQIRVTPKDSLPQPEIEDNIQTNLELITEWLDIGVSRPPDPTKVAWLLGGGPSLDEAFNLGFYKASMFRENPEHSLWLCKHALPLFREGWDDIPLNVVALDPRPIDGTSTHGVKRLSLYDSAPKHTVFYLASMTSPSVTRHLLERGHRVVGWHAASESLKKFATEERKILPKNFHEHTQTGPLSISGGTSSLLRAVGLTREAFGITRFRLLGLDSSLKLTEEERGWSRDPNSAWRLETDSVTGAIRRMEITYGAGGYPTWTTGELCAQAQDLEALFKARKQLGIELKIVGTDKGRSLAGSIYDKYQDL